MIKTNGLYYKSRLLAVRDSTMKDAFDMAPHMRESDKQEIWASNHISPENALVGGVINSVVCLTAEMNEKPIIMGGIVPQSLLGHTAIIWVLGTDDMKKIAKTFLKTSRSYIDHMLEFYPYLFNYIDVRNKESLLWLKYCGAEFSLTVPYGVEQKPFRYFCFRRK